MALIPPTRVLVTGGAGFVGGHILEALGEKHPDWALYSLDQRPPPRGPVPGVTYLSGDIVSAESVSDALASARPHAIVHTAGIVPPTADRWLRRLEKLVHRINVTGTETVVNAARARRDPPVRALVYTSSCCAVIDDTRFMYPNFDEEWRTTTDRSSIYGESKARSERLVLGASDPRANGGLGFRTCAVRPSVVFGPDDYQLIPSVHACIAKGEVPFVVGDGTNLWDVVDVRNVADAHVLALENLLPRELGGSGRATAQGRAFLVSNDEPVPFRDLCLEIWKHFGVCPAWEVRIPSRLAVFGAAITGTVAWLLGTTTTWSSGNIRDGIAVRYCSNAAARNVLGYVPRIGLEQGLRESCEALKLRLEDSKKKGIVKANEAAALSDDLVNRGKVKGI